MPSERGDNILASLIGAFLTIVALAALLTLPGCYTPLEPVITPPAAFQFSSTATVQFVDHPELACLARGVLVPAGACSDTHYMTVLNPCLVPLKSHYDLVLCHELAHKNGWPPNHSAGIPPASESPEAKRH
jgi:hypothetical protein